MEQEVWKRIIGYEGRYDVSNKGVFKSLERTVRGRHQEERLLSLHQTKRGYILVSLSKPGLRNKKYAAHRLVAKAFIPNPENKTQVNHKNGIRNDNRVENLEWNTPQENVVHSFKVLKKKVVFSEITRQKISAQKKGVSNYKCLRPITQFDLNGIKIKDYPGVAVASRELGLSQCAIRFAISGRRKTCGGFKWSKKLSAKENGYSKSRLKIEA